MQCFEELGQSWIITEELIKELTRFVCTLYGKMMDDVDLLRYQIFCAKGGKVDPETLPPCFSTLLLHIERANYQACVWRKAIVANPSIPPPDRHGWNIINYAISIKWLGSNPAPEEVLELLNCLCKRTCKVEDCTCLIAGLKCTTLCTAKCNNMVNEEELIEVPSQNNEELEEDIDASDIEEDD